MRSLNIYHNYTLFKILFDITTSHYHNYSLSEVRTRYHNYICVLCVWHDSIKDIFIILVIRTTRYQNYLLSQLLVIISSRYHNYLLSQLLAIRTTSPSLASPLSYFLSNWSLALPLSTGGSDACLCKDKQKLGKVNGCLFAINNVIFCYTLRFVDCTPFDHLNICVDGFCKYFYSFYYLGIIQIKRVGVHFIHNYDTQPEDILIYEVNWNMDNDLVWVYNKKYFMKWQWKQLKSIGHTAA